jgi:hypothetical protein
MSKRLQVLVPDPEMEQIRRMARREDLTVGEWVRQTLRLSWSQRSIADPALKLRAIRKAAEYSFPTADIDEMLREIEDGYRQ